MEKEAGHKADADIRNCVRDKAHGSDIFTEQKKTKEVHRISEVPHSHADHKKEKNQFASRLMFSLHNEDRKDDMQDGA